MKSILLIHGWMHTINIFNSICLNLKDYNVVKFTINGFDNNKYTSLEKEISILKEYLNSNKYDLIIAHSIGAYMVIKTGYNNSKILLLNPVCNNFKWYINILMSLTKYIDLIKSIQSKYHNPILIRIIALLMCNDFNKIDSTMLEGINICNSKFIYESILYSRNKIDVQHNNYTIIHSIKDRLLNTPVDLINVSNNIYYLKCGHTSFIERAEDILCQIINLI